MKVTVTKPAKTKTWNPRDRFFWAVLWASVSYYFLTGMTRIVPFMSLEFWVINVAGFLIWWAFQYFVLENWVFGPKDD